MKKLRKLTPLRPLSKLEQGEDKVENTVIKNSMVTREQYDHDITIVEKIEESLAHEIHGLKTELAEVKESLSNRNSDTKVLAALWALTTLFAIVAVLILAILG
jgi:nitrogen fixation/metabolism regulation signal transduction histidine kinase